jgi:hypothetical protein
MIAVRQSMHGPLWTVERKRDRVQLWAPNDERDHWQLAWTEWDDEAVMESGCEQVATLDDVGSIGLVPSQLARQVRAVLAEAKVWDPAEPCDHTRATSYGVRKNGRVCGYCGRLYPEPEEPATELDAEDIAHLRAEASEEWQARGGGGL